MGLSLPHILIRGFFRMNVRPNFCAFRPHGQLLGLSYLGVSVRWRTSLSILGYFVGFLEDTDCYADAALHYT
jgi:hypothetical protein